MRLIWQVPFGTLLLDTLQKYFAALFTAEHRAAGVGVIWLRHVPSSPGRTTESTSGNAANNEFRVLRAINEEIFCRWVCWFTIRKATAPG